MRRISSLLNKHAQLADISEQANQLIATQQLWAKVVPAGLKKYTQAGNVKHKRLTIYADNGAVAAKIKLMLPSLLINLQKQGLEVTSIRVEVQVKSHPKAPNKVMRTVSKQGAASLGQMAEQLEGSALGDALKRLSERT